MIRIRTLLAAVLLSSMVASAQSDDDAPIPYGVGESTTDQVTPK